METKKVSHENGVNINTTVNDVYYLVNRCKDNSTTIGVVGKGWTFIADNVQFTTNGEPFRTSGTMYSVAGAKFQLDWYKLYEFIPNFDHKVWGKLYDELF